MQIHTSVISLLVQISDRNDSILSGTPQVRVPSPKVKQSFSARQVLPDRQKLPTQFLLLSRILFVIQSFEQGANWEPGHHNPTRKRGTALVIRYHVLGIFSMPLVPQGRATLRNIKMTRTTPWMLALAIAYLSLAAGCKSNVGHNGMGVSLFQQGRYSEALQSFHLAKQTEPANPDVYYNLASTYHRLGTNAKDAKMVETAEALYNQCLELSPNHVDCHRGLAVLLVESGRSDRAFALLKNWSQRVPTLADARVELARLHQEFNQTKVAEQYLDEALSIDPRNPNAWAAKGKLRENSGELMQAIQNYQQSLALNAGQPDLYQRISALNVRLAQGTSNPNSPSVIAGQTPTGSY